MGAVGQKAKNGGLNAVILRRKTMSVISKRAKISILFATAAMLASGSAIAQQEEAPAPRESKDILVEGQREVLDAAALAALPKGPEIKGFISARRSDKVQITTESGTKTIINLTEFTRIKSSRGLFSSAKLAENSLLNGLPVTIKTLQSGEQLIASQINLRGKDFKTASMIRNGTEQGFAEQTAATEALRGRVGDIDEYNIKGTTNVNFDTGKAVLSEQGKSELCQAVTTAQGTKNAFILVVGYTDSTGSDEFNQVLSEKRANRVVNHIQQACGWKPYRMLTPTGMAKADPLADNSTVEGKAQNRRVAVNILVSKGLDGL
jgi:OmpA-OmpF porin, OOP family